MIVSLLVLRLKAVESLLDQSVYLRKQQRESAENPDYEMWKEQILSGIGEDQD